MGGATVEKTGNDRELAQADLLQPNVHKGDGDSVLAQRMGVNG